MCAQAMKRGAANFLTIPVNGADLLAAVRRALEHDHHARQARVERGRHPYSHRKPHAARTRSAGTRRDRWEGTIKVHRGRVMEKMRVASVAELVRLMERCGSDFQAHPEKG